MKATIKEFVKEYLALEQESIKEMVPPGNAVTVIWHTKAFVGGYQYLDPDVVYLSITSKPVTKEFARELRQQQPNRHELTADNDLDLTGRGHILRKIEKTLCRLTPEQTPIISCTRQWCLNYDSRDHSLWWQRDPHPRNSRGSAQSVDRNR